MQYQQLGSTGVFVSKLCFGAMTFGGKGTIFEVIGGLSQKDSDSLIGQTIDAGINFFDTANVYGQGDSETQLAKALGDRRKDVVIATKVFGRMGEGANNVGLSRLHIMQQCDASLKRMKTDYIDLYQIHGFDSLTSLDETMRALDDLVRQGKVRYIGCSNLAAWQVMKAQCISTVRNLEHFVTLQAYYSLVGRDLEREIVPMLKDQGMGLLPWSPLAGGWLSGRWRKGADDLTSRRSALIPQRYDLSIPANQQKLDAADALGRLADETGISLIHIALAFVIRHPAVTAAIIGPRTMEQLESQIGAVDVELSDDVLDRIDEIVPPGTTINPTDAGWTNPALEARARRR